jgi:hypothetical protein
VFASPGGQDEQEGGEKQQEQQQQQQQAPEQSQEQPDPQHQEAPQDANSGHGANYQGSSGYTDTGSNTNQDSGLVVVDTSAVVGTALLHFSLLTQTSSTSASTSLRVRWATQRALLHLLCQSNELIVLMDDNSNSNNKNKGGDSGTASLANACLSLDRWRRRRVEEERSDDKNNKDNDDSDDQRENNTTSSTSSYFTLLGSSAEADIDDQSMVQYIPYSSWTIRYNIYNVGALYRNQVDTNQQSLVTMNLTDETAGGGNNQQQQDEEGDGQGENPAATDDAIQVAAAEILGRDLQTALNRSIRSKSFDKLVQLYYYAAESSQDSSATAAKAEGSSMEADGQEQQEQDEVQEAALECYASVSGEEFSTFSSVYPPPVNPILGFFQQTVNDWAWDPIHISCVVLLGSLLVGVVVLTVILCKRRRLLRSKNSMPLPLRSTRNNRTAFFGEGKGDGSGSSTGNDESLSIQFPDVLALDNGDEVDRGDRRWRRRVRPPRPQRDDPYDPETAAAAAALTNRSVRSGNSLTSPVSSPSRGDTASASASMSLAGLPFAIPDGASVAEATAEIAATAPSIPAAFDASLYAMLDAEEHYARANEVDEEDLKGDWGSCLIPLPGSLRSKKKAQPVPSSSSSLPAPVPHDELKTSAAASCNPGILRPPSYATSGPIDLEGVAAAAALDASSSHETATAEDGRGGGLSSAVSRSSTSSSSFGIEGESLTLAYETDMDATMEIDADTGRYVSKKMKKVSFRYVEAVASKARRSSRPNGDGESDDDDEGSLSSLSGVYVDGGLVPSDEEHDAFAPSVAPTTPQPVPGSLLKSQPVDTDSLLTADQVGAMPSEIGTCALVGLSSQGESGRKEGGAASADPDGTVTKDSKPWDFRSLLGRRTGGGSVQP